jgi:hypothetical protein
MGLQFSLVQSNIYSFFVATLIDSECGTESLLQTTASIRTAKQGMSVLIAMIAMMV